MQSYNPATAGTAAVWAPPRSLATTGGITFCFLLLRLLRCFSSPGSPPCKAGMTGHQPAGLPHSEIRGSQVACTSPRLIAACHVLHRLPEPRHPPSALVCFRLQAVKNTLPHLPSCGLHGRTVNELCSSTELKFRAFVFLVYNMSMNEPNKKRAMWRITDSNR